MRMDREEAEGQEPPIFSKRAKTAKKQQQQQQRLHHASQNSLQRGDCIPDLGFSNLGLSEWLLKTCEELGMKRPTPVQYNCVPQILMGKDVLGIAQTGSGKTAAFALPILQTLAANLYGVFALVLTPTRELAFQLSDQFKALGSGLHLRCAVVVGGLDMIEQARLLMQRPHVVVATPGRITDLLSNDPDIVTVFQRLKFLVLDEADRVLDVSFEDELRTILFNLPSERQTLLFSATMTAELKALHKLSGDKAFIFEAYEGLKTVDQLQQQYIFVPANVKDVYLAHVMSSMEERNICSAIIFASTCRTCHLLILMLEELGIGGVALHSLKTQQQRLSALNCFKSGQAHVLIATDVASRGLDIPTVDLVVNYDIPRFARDYIHRVGRTARAGRGGCAVSLVTQFDVELVHNIEALIGTQLEEYEVDEDDVLQHITKVYKAKRIAGQKMEDSGFEQMAKSRKEMKMKALASKGLLNMGKLSKGR
eukprot:c27539_g1_i1 orf=487-1929(-)